MKNATLSLSGSPRNKTVIIGYHENILTAVIIGLDPK